METEKRNNGENDAGEENKVGRKRQKKKKMLLKGFLFKGNATHFSACILAKFSNLG